MHPSTEILLLFPKSQIEFRDFDHSKDMIDSINTYDKRCLIGKMCMIGTPEVEDSESRINSNTIIGSISCSLTKEYKRYSLQDTSNYL